ncbi:DUF2461 domain-containing protein [Ginsengibacter hankyongi]|uniref:DUF2461 domain-containing protein n=1 Tax=Ginsengibacter hankyongi TaxID=2607284 RepID=A0A5J5IPZ9_9BACT|nr:DUF2461 domain-containing protein [Ginsengibacter hankyongi]KAA9042084.1 DUF2461 domain-containing protein [Ginsengibacter hankyongi]
MFHASTVSFLKELKKNNNKTWFDDHKAKYLSAKIDFENFVRELIVKISAFDDDIKELQPKNCTFRINRDIRFSKDKTPYKTNMGASFNRGGKKSIFAGYYFHLEPGGKSFAGGGLWMPEPIALKKLRQEIDYCFPEFKKIITSSSFKKQYPGLEMDQKQMLVNVPKGYDKENPAAAFLKLKSFVATKDIRDTLLSNKDLVKEAEQAFRALMPLVKFINRSME